MHEIAARAALHWFKGHRRNAHLRDSAAVRGDSLHFEVWRWTLVSLRLTCRRPEERTSKARRPPAPCSHRPNWGKTSTPDSTHKRAYVGVQTTAHRFGQSEKGRLEDLVAEMRGRGYPWQIVIYHLDEDATIFVLLQPHGQSFWVFRQLYLLPRARDLFECPLRS